MILEQLTLRNFCLFGGEQSFELAPTRRNGKHLPIVLFGGINGGGKTTLLDAMQLALYGPRARCSKRSNLGYDDFLRACVHNEAEPGARCGVSLSFRYAADGEEHLYDVNRSWRVQDGRVREELRVFQDGAMDAWLSENWPQLVEELFPVEISQLFLFDAEKIRSLAEDETSSRALGAAIKSLLGLDIVERLVADATVLQGRLVKRAGAPEHQAQVEALEQQLRDHQAELERLNAERAALENKRLRAQTDLAQVEERFAAVGGKHWEARHERIRRLGEVESVVGEIETQLLALAGGELPLALVPDLLTRIEEQDGHERLAAEAEVVQRLLTERDEQLLEALRSSRAGPKVLRLVTTHLEKDRRTREPSSPICRRLDLSEAGRSLLRHLRDQRLAGLQRETHSLLEKLARLVHEREDLERAAAVTPADAEISAVMEGLKAAMQAFTLVSEQAQRLDAQIATRRAALSEWEKKFSQLCQGTVDKEFAAEDTRRMVQLAGRTRDTMQQFLQRVTERKIDRLSGLITESFRFLLRKQALVERIIIDPATFAITLYDTAGQPLAKQRLSEGEKQIFAIAVLWGLARASARPLPAAIDTPMARLDAAHRQHLVERYFPNASHQVVIFSTDTEVDRHSYQLLQPSIARAYHLNYDERTRVTVGEEGYFWKE